MCNDPAYKDAPGAVVEALAISPTAVRDIRAIEPRLCRVAPEIVERAVPGVERRLADFLCAPWDKGLAEWYLAARGDQPTRSNYLI